MSVVIECSIISKCYRIGLSETKPKTLVERISNSFNPIKNFRKLKKLNRFYEEDESVFWALRDVSFEVKEGEVLGIIGKNGAGKSTLLKILSQISEPTSGKIKIQGRVASLLEVGTGFHPELSGRDNIYMNGTILGMTRREIDSKLDEIIDFSGVEKFIDTPVKFYSSGMKVRLGFSVAAHLEPEILIIDEVLAVGDYEFQKKCLGKMEDVAGKGRTVLFVSHNMEAIKNLCHRSLLIRDGKIEYSGSNIDAINHHISTYNSVDDAFLNLSNHPDKKWNNLGIHTASISVNGIPSNNIISGNNLSIRFSYMIEEAHLGIPMEVGFGIFNSEGKGILAFNNSNFKKKVFFKNVSGYYTITIPSFPFYTSETLNLTFYFGYLGDEYEVLNFAAKLHSESVDYLGFGFPLDRKLNTVYIPEIQFQVEI